MTEQGKPLCSEQGSMKFIGPVMLYAHSAVGLFEPIGVSMHEAVPYY